MLLGGRGVTLGLEPEVLRDKRAGVASGLVNGRHLVHSYPRELPCSVKYEGAGACMSLRGAVMARWWFMLRTQVGVCALFPLNATVTLYWS